MPEARPTDVPTYRACTSADDGLMIREFRRLATQADVVAAFNRDRDFVIVDHRCADNGLNANRRELFIRGHREFIVYYHGNERTVALKATAASRATRGDQP